MCADHALAHIDGMVIYADKSGPLYLFAVQSGELFQTLMTEELAKKAHSPCIWHLTNPTIPTPTPRLILLFITRTPTSHDRDVWTCCCM
jgi:hypothetical protein